MRYYIKNVVILKIMKGIIIGYLFTIPVFLIAALFLANTDFPDKYISSIITVVTFLSIVISSSIASKGINNRGWLRGALTALIYFLLLYTVSALIYWDFEISSQTLIMVIFGVLFGMVGGILGINIKTKEKLKYQSKKK